MYGHFSGINRKVQMKYQPKGRPRGSSSDDVDKPAEPSLVLILKWGGELTPAGRIQAEELGRIFRCMYPGGQGRHFAGEYAGAQGLGLLRLHSTFRHDLKIYASDEGRVQMTAAAFAKGLLALEGELTPILVQMVKSANTNGLLDNDCDSSKYQNMCKSRLHELMQMDRDFTQADREKINPCNSVSINDALDFVKNPSKCCKHVHELIKSLMEIVQVKKEDGKTKEAILYHGETWDLMYRRWGKIEKDFYTKNRTFDISKIPDIYDCIKYDLQHNQHTIQFEQAEELYIYAKYLADIVIPQEYGLTAQEKLTIGQGICTPLLKKIKADLQRNIEETEETVNRLNPRYSHGVSSPGRHVRTRLYFTSESHIHSLITVLRHGGLLDVMKDEQWRRAMEYVGMVSELNYMAQIVIMLYEDPTKDPCSEERFHIELHFSPGVNCCVQKNLPPGPGFRPHSRNESAASKNSSESTSATPTPEDNKNHPIGEISIIEEEKCTVFTPKVLEASLQHDLSPDYSPEISPTYTYTTYNRFSKTSVPIPIGSAHTVCGHEALHLAKCLTEELANQVTQQGSRSYGNRADSPEPEPRSRSYDHKSPQKGKECGQAIKRHRHGIAGQMSYFKVMGFSYGPGAIKRYAGGSANSLFSTAVISGSSSAPNLRDMIPSTASASAIEGFGGVPPIRPLETLHNALSLKQIDAFLDSMTTAPLYRTPSSTPPKYPSTPLPTPTCSAVADYGLSQGKGAMLKLQSPCNSVGWSGPPSFVSSSGPSSPGLSDTNSKESSEMSSSIISADGLNLDELTKIFPTAPGLDKDLGRVGMTLDTLDKEISGSLEFSEYYANFHKPQGESGEITPISCGSEAEFNTNDATAGSSSAPEFDFTITEDIDKGDLEMTDNNETVTSAKSKSFIDNCNALRSIYSENSSSPGTATPRVISPLTANVNVCTNDLNSTDYYSTKPVSNIKRAHSLYSKTGVVVSSIDIINLVKDFSKFEKEVTSSSVNIAKLSCLKWSTSKEKFLEINKSSDGKTDNIDFGKNLNTGALKKIDKDTDLMAKLTPGTILVKESYIEPPKISRVSKSFHGKSSTSTSYLDISNVPRRASDIPLTSGLSCDLPSPAANLPFEGTARIKNRHEPVLRNRPQFITQMSQPCGESAKFSGNLPRKGSLTTETVAKNPRFTTTRVDEAEHAASIGIFGDKISKRPKNSEVQSIDLNTNNREANSIGDKSDPTKWDI